MMKKLLLLMSAVCLILSSCSNYGGEIVIPDPDLIITEDVTEISEFSPIIMPEKDDEKFQEYAEVIGEENCIPGYVYLYQKRLDPTNSKLTLLIPQRVDRAAGLFQSRDQSGSFRYVYCLSEDRTKLIRADKTTGETEDFTCKEGEIDLLVGTDNIGSGTAEKNDFLFFKAGNTCYVLDGVQGKIIRHFESPNGISDIKSGYDFAMERAQGGVDDPFYCEECGASGVLWENDSGRYYWFHPHSGTNQYIDFESVYYPFYSVSELRWKFFPDESGKGDDSYIFDREYHLQIPSGAFENSALKKAQLLVYNRRTGESTVLLDNVVDADDSGNITAIVRDDSGERLQTVNANDGTVKTIYKTTEGTLSILFSDDSKAAFSDGNSLMAYFFRQKTTKTFDGLTTDEDISIYRFEDLDLLKTKDTLYKLNFGEMTAEKLFGYDNGMSRLRLINGEERNSLQTCFPDEDFSDSYECAECKKTLQTAPPFIWADDNGSWYWYHPHSGEITAVDVQTYAEYDDLYYIKEK